MPKWGADLVAAGAVDHPHDAADEAGDGEAAVVEEHMDQEHQVGPVPLVLGHRAGGGGRPASEPKKAACWIDRFRTCEMGSLFLS